MPPQHENQVSYVPKEDTQKIHDRFVTIGWALFLILIGVIWLIPKDVLPEGAFFLGVGAILLGLSLVKFLMGLKTSETVIFLGIIAGAVGLRGLLEIKLPLIPIIVIVLGSFILAGVLFRRKQE
jgi:hypothetical protein